MEDLADLFELDVETLRGLERMGEKSAQNLVEAIARSRKKINWPRLLYGLGIPHVGRALAGDLAQHFKNLDELARADEDALMDIESIGPKVASAVVEWFRNDRNRALGRKLKKQGIAPRIQKQGRRIQGKTLVITGTLESMTRDEAQELIRQQGGRASSSVSGQTDYLVVGASPGQSKLQDAEEHDIETIDEQRFLALCGQRS